MWYSSETCVDISDTYFGKQLLVPLYFRTLAIFSQCFHACAWTLAQSVFYVGLGFSAITGYQDFLTGFLFCFTLSGLCSKQEC